MATSPTTAPMQKPSAEAFLPFIISKNIQASPAAAARLLAAVAEPALKPNQPNQSKPVPNNTYGMRAGLIDSPVICTLRLFKTMEPAKAAQPAEICTTVPPAKSNTPILNKMPSGFHVQCASGA